MKLGAVAMAAGGVTSIARASTHVAPGKDAQPARGANPSRAPKHLRRSTYTRYLRSHFRIHRAEASPLGVRLVEIRDVTGAAGREDAFSLLFHGPADAAFRQDDRFTVEHRALGRFPLFVVPVGGARRGQHYEAIVNRG